MTSFRDRRFPELLRFPGLWRPRILVLAGLLINSLAALLCWWFETGAPRPREAELGLLAAISLWMLACWPREIVCGPAGVEQRKRFWLGITRIGWGEVRALEPGEEFFGIGKRFGLETSVVCVVSGRAEIRHTPRHPDRERFLRECRMRMEEWAAKQGLAREAPQPVHRKEGA